MDGGKSDAVNLGTGRGTSVKEIVDATARVTGHRASVPHRMSPPWGTQPNLSPPSARPARS